MWVKLDDQVADHPKIVVLSDAEFRTWLHGIVYSGKQLTDGFLPDGVVPRLVPASVPDWRGVLAALQRGEPVAGRWPLWERAVGGFHIHDYHDYQPSAADVRARREVERLRLALSRALAERGWKGRKRLSASELGELPAELRVCFEPTDGGLYRRRTLSVGGNTSRSLGSRLSVPSPSPSPSPLFPPSPSLPPPSSDDVGYVERVLEWFVALPGTPETASADDRRAVRELELRGVDLERVRFALSIGTARRAASSVADEAVRSFRYFVRVLDELGDDAIDPGYAEFIQHKAGLS